MLYISKKILSIIGASKKIRYDFDKMLKLIFLLLDILYNNTTIIGNISHTGITNLIILYPNNKLHKINKTKLQAFPLWNKLRKLT